MVQLGIKFATLSVRHSSGGKELGVAHKTGGGRMLRQMRRKEMEGFTLIELMVVIAIIGILAAIAIPNFVSYRKRSYNSAANADSKNLYTSAQAYYTDNHAGATTSLDDFKAYGFRQTPDVDVAVQGSGSQGSFSADLFHSSGDKTFHVASDGSIGTSS